VSEERRREIADHLRSSDADVRLCATTEELHHLAMTACIDAVIVEQALPGFLTGLDILSRLAGDLVKPVSILVGELTSAEQAQAASLHLSAVLPSDSAAECIASATLGALLTREQGLPIPLAARLLVRNAVSIRPAPQLIARLARFLQDDPAATTAALAKDIATDARTTAELMKLVNSSYLGLSAKVTKIQDAVNLVGIKRTVALVLSTYLMERTGFASWALPGELERRLRFRSLLMGATASTYAAMTRQSSPDTAYVLALLQDLGVMVLAHELGGKYQRILQRCRTVTHLQLPTYEQQDLGYTHADVSGALLQKWSLPSGLIRLVLLHHQPVESLAASPEERGWLQAMQVAEAVADLRDQATPQRQLLLQRKVAKWGRMDEAALRNCLAQAVAKTNELSHLLSVSPPDDDAMRQLVETLATTTGVALPVEGQPLSEASGSARRRIVALHHDQVALQTIEEWLAGTEFELWSGSNADEPQHAARTAAAILCELNAGADELTEVLRRLRRDGVLAPVFVISADRSRQSVLRSIEAGASEFLVKPLDRDILLSKLRSRIAAT
jgi:HD-like signal output (HDOD) protein/DNA-binding response OmpR family regulator